jgi:hypothetical protein
MATDTTNAIKKKVKPLTREEVKAEQKRDRAFMNHKPSKKK